MKPLLTTNALVLKQFAKSAYYLHQNEVLQRYCFHPFVCLFVCLSVCLFVCLLPPPTKLGGIVFVPVCLLVCLFVCLFVCLSVCEQLPDHNFSRRVMKLSGTNCDIKIWK